MIAKYISVESDSILHICIQEPLLISTKIIVLLHTLSAYKNSSTCCKVYSSDPRKCLCKLPEGMLKPMKTLVLIQHHFERILYKKKSCHTKLSAPITRRKLHSNNRVTAKVCLVLSLILRKITLK